MPDISPAPGAPGAPNKPATPKPAMSLGIGHKAPVNVGGNISEVVDELNNTNTRLKILEERYSNMRRKVQVVEQNMIDEQKKAIVEIKTNIQELNDVKKIIEDLKDKMRLIIKEVKLSAKSEDVEELKKYIEIWEPLNFVTRAELKKMLEGELREIIREEITASK